MTATTTEPTGYEYHRTWADDWLDAELKKTERGQVVEIDRNETCDACGRLIYARERCYRFPRVQDRPERIACLDCGGAPVVVAA